MRLHRLLTKSPVNLCSMQGRTKSISRVEINLCVQYYVDRMLVLEQTKRNSAEWLNDHRSDTCWQAEYNDCLTRAVIIDNCMFGRCRAVSDFTTMRPDQISFLQHAGEDIAYLVKANNDLTGKATRLDGKGHFKTRYPYYVMGHDPCKRMR